MKVKWHYHLTGKDPERLRTLVRAVDDNEEVLTVIHASFKRVIKACRIHATDEVVGEAALCTVNSVEYGKKVQDPFYIDMKDNTHVQIPDSLVADIELYCAVRDRLGGRGPSRVSIDPLPAQALDTLMTQAAAFHGVEVTDEMSSQAAKQMTELDWQCLQFCIQLLDHRLPRDAYENVIISGLSILGIQKEGGG